MKFTKQRLLAASVILIVASIIMSLVEVELAAYFAGLLMGMAIVALIAFLFARPRE
jgi:hypothetical protein